LIAALLDANVKMDMEDTGRPLSKLAASVLQKPRANVDFFIHELQWHPQQSRKLWIARPRA
jgi:hypothetical protein